MAWRRAIYAILLIASVVAFIVTDSGVALFFSLCLAGFPILSLILLCFAKHKLKFDFSVRASCMRGNALQITMRAKLLPRFLAGYVSATGAMENTTFDKTDRKVFSFQDLSDAPHTFDYVSADSGRIVVHFPKIRLIDIFGICAIRVKCAKHAEAIVSPVLYDDANVRIVTSSKNTVAGDVSLSQKGYDSTEVFGVRDYIPGDLLNSVHWKLSGKFGEIKTKEYGSSDDRRTLILVDVNRTQLSGGITPDEWLNCVLDVAVSVSNSFVKSGYLHTVGWFNNGEFICSDVTDGDSFLQTVEKLMSVRINGNAAEDCLIFMRSPACSAFTKIIYVAAAANPAVAKESGGYDFTVLSVDDDAVVFDNGSAKFITVPCSGISEALSSFEL